MAMNNPIRPLTLPEARARLAATEHRASEAMGALAAARAASKPADAAAITAWAQIVEALTEQTRLMREEIALLEQQAAHLRDLLTLQAVVVRAAAQVAAGPGGRERAEQARQEYAALEARLARLEGRD